jgi:CheY-like chemotaxis protein
VTTSADRILIVDDDRAFRLSTAALLRSDGHVVEAVGDGQSAVDALRAQRFDLVLLDIRMPGIDGVEVLRQIRGEPELHSLPVSMLTTTDDPIEVARCHKIGCNNYIVKPVDYQKFADAIQRMGLFVKLVQVPSPEAAGRR